MNVKPLLKGLATYIPGVYQIFRTKHTGGTDSARYCYSVWLRHLVMAHNNCLSTEPIVVAELGPGDSIGIGLAALISGADTYYAFDVFEYTNVERNLKIFDELVSLFKDKEDIPDENGLPKVNPRLNSHKFPCEILTDERLSIMLNDRRIGSIRKSIMNMNTYDSMIHYKVPWFDANTLEEESVDMIYSQAVLEHVDDLSQTYKAMYSWLKTKGYMSHQIDFRCHGTADTWNGHWIYSDFTWKLIRGKRPFLLNREPYSTHVRLLKETGFHKVGEIKCESASKIERNDLSPRFRHIAREDLMTSGVCVQAQKTNQ